MATLKTTATTVVELTVKITGNLWYVSEFEIEGINVKNKWEEDNKSGWVTVKNLELSIDNILDVYVYLTAPNGTEYKLEITGKIVGDNKKIKYTENFKIRGGKLRINLSKSLNEIIK